MSFLAALLALILILILILVLVLVHHALPVHTWVLGPPTGLGALA